MWAKERRLYINLVIKAMDRDQDDSPLEEKSRKGKEEFKCGESKCNKLYHSYTAFYNHCKKAHNG